MRTKLQAADLATAQGIDTVVTNGKDPDRKFRSEQVIDEVKRTYSKYYYDHGKLVGTILIGDISGMSDAIRKMK